MRFRNIFPLLVLVTSGSVALAEDKPAVAVPADFKIVAKFSPGLSNWRHWEYTITADGKVAQDIGPGGGGNPPGQTQKETKVSKDDVAAIYAKVMDADFFKLKKQYRGLVTDQPILDLEITANKKTHHVQLYAHHFLTAKADQAAADRFLSVWSEVLRKVPAPNPKQTPEMYKPGQYGKK